MRDFDIVRAYIPPINVVPGSTLSIGSTDQVGGQAMGTDYVVEKDGWYVEITDPGLYVTSSPRAGPPYYEFEGVHRSEIVWTPFARMDMALVPLSQQVAEGKCFESFHSKYEALTISGLTFPEWNGVVCRVVDIWTSERISDLEAANLFANGLMPGNEPAYPLDVYSGLNMPIANPANIDHKLRFDQIISARYREMISSSNAPTSQFFGGQLMTVLDTTIGGNASISDKIHHTRYVRFVSSNDGGHNIASPAGSGSSSSSTYNYAKVGFFVPGATDSLTIGLEKIENDAEWATIARRGATR